MHRTIFFAALLVACAVALPVKSPKAIVNNRPVIGILSQPVGDEANDNYKDYIAASYVKYLEAAGARVVPIPYDATTAQIDNMLSGLNGVLFPGGGADLSAKSQFFQTAAHVFQRVIEANDAGEHVAIWGTCLGFQTICTIVSGDHNLLKQYDSENLTLALDMTAEAEHSRIFSPAPSRVLESLTSLPITLNNHMWGVDPQDMRANTKLSQMFDVLSTNKDRVGKVFVSTIEAKHYPVYASQWHPEKVQFEWNPDEVIAHSAEAISAMQYMADFFVSEARKSTRSFPQDVLTSRLIYQYTPVYTGGPGKSFEQTYYNIKYV